MAYIQVSLPFGSVYFTESTALLRLPRFQKIFTFLDIDGPREFTQTQGTDLEGNTFTGGGKGRAPIWELNGLIYMRVLIDIFRFRWKT